MAEDRPAEMRPTEVSSAEVRSVEARLAEVRVAEGRRVEVRADEVRAAISEIVAGGAAQMGPVMKGLRDKFGARLDGKLASELAREALSKKI